MSDIEERLQHLELRLEKVEEVLHLARPRPTDRLAKEFVSSPLTEARSPGDEITLPEAPREESVGRVPPGSLAPGDRILLDDSSSVWCVKRVHSHLRNFSVTVEAEAPWGEIRHIHLDVAGSVHRIFS